MWQVALRERPVVVDKSVLLASQHQLPVQREINLLTLAPYFEVENNFPTDLHCSDTFILL